MDQQGPAVEPAAEVAVQMLSLAVTDRLLLQRAEWAWRLDLDCERAALPILVELVAALVPRAEMDIAQRFLVPNPHRDGYVLADDKDAVEGLLLWSNGGGPVGTPYDVLIGGRKLTWDELGRALEAYEGWRFRIELADRIEDLRSHANGALD